VGAEDGLAERGLRTVDGEVGRGGDLPRPQQERLGVVRVVVEVDRDDRARPDLVAGRRLADPGAAQQFVQVADARLLLALLLLGGVVAAVLPQVALFAPSVDLRGDRRSVGDELLELGLQTVVRVLGEPGGGRLAVGAGH
jgi:hypothetical protein